MSPSKMSEGWVYDIQRFSLHDGPGIRTTVFLKGCPLKCLWCHNPESQSPLPEVAEFKERCIGCGACIEVCPEKAITETKWFINREICTKCGRCAEVCPSGARKIFGKKMTAEDVLREVRKDKLFYKNSGGGVTLSGGEPLMQPLFSRELLRMCKKENIYTAIETSGYASWSNFKKILPFTDLIFYDIKHIDPLKHKEFTGKSNVLILDNFKKIVKEDLDIVIRIPSISGYNDAKEQITIMGEFLKGLKGIVQIELVPYHKLGISKYKRIGREYGLTINTPSENQINEARNLLESYGFEVKIARGRGCPDRMYKIKEVNLTIGNRHYLRSDTSCGKR